MTGRAPRRCCAASRTTCQHAVRCRCHRLCLPPSAVAPAQRCASRWRSRPRPARPLSAHPRRSRRCSRPREATATTATRSARCWRRASALSRRRVSTTRCTTRLPATGASRRRRCRHRPASRPMTRASPPACSRLSCSYRRVDSRGCWSPTTAAIPSRCMRNARFPTLLRWLWCSRPPAPSGHWHGSALRWAAVRRTAATTRHSRRCAKAFRRRAGCRCSR